MLSIVRVHLPSDIPIAGCEISPYVLLRKPDNSLSTEDVPESNPSDGFFLRCRWYRVQSDKKLAMCSVHPSEPATLQCLGCVKARVPVAKSYHCSTQCYSASWRYHVSLHTRTYAVSSRDTLDDELFGKYGSAQGSNANPVANSASNVANGANASMSNGWNHGNANRERLDNQQPQQQANGEVWYEVGRGKNYTPTAEDVGYVLKLECVAVDASTAQTVGPISTVLTSRVIPAPSPSPRRMIQLPVHTNDGMLNIPSMMLSHGDNLGRGPIRGERGTFTVLSYNVLADLYATSDMYSYCPPWALSWSYRRQNLLRELVEYGADIMCLQEVQSDHYEEFFASELEKHGYASVYKKKTAEMYTGTSYAIDGCATFFRRDKFSLVKKYEVEFNKAALSLAEALNSNSKKAALNRLLKDNVALIVVLESRDSVEGSDNLSAGKRQLLCVANTHIHANPELKDVKLWQVHTLLKGLEKIAASADIPMLVTGDFNSVPGSAPHSLLATGRVDPSHPELATDPLGILRPASKLCHQLPLMSAYASQGQLNHRLDTTSSEPIFTNCTRDFFGTLDYIFFTVDSLQVESLLELLDEETLRKDTALPSPEWSSDHIALLAEFRYKPRNRR